MAVYVWAYNVVKTALVPTPMNLSPVINWNIVECDEHL